jgi:hypothetical protein
MRIVKSLLVGIAVVLVSSTSAFALTAHGYESRTPISPGLAVAHSENQSEQRGQVELASPSNSSRFAGISIKQSDAVVTTTTQASNVYVATEGEVNVVVSDINGTVRRGDNLVLSPLKGVLMKANVEETAAIGVALQDQTDENSTTETVNNRGNTNYEAKLSTLLVDINPKAIEPTTQRQSFLVLFGESLTGKDVTALQVGVAFLIFFLVLIIEGSIIYGSIYSSIIALGRNPLSKSAVYKDLVQVTILALAILASGVGAIFLILWA